MGAVKGKPGYNLDAPELIGQCLRCAKPECDNCLARRAGADARRAFDRWEELIALYNAGVIYQDIGEQFGISKEKAGVWYTFRCPICGGEARVCKSPYNGHHAGECEGCGRRFIE